jgi:Protein of unknown function (DUF2281)
MTTADRIYALINALPPDQANEVLDFAEFLQQKIIKKNQSLGTEQTYNITKTKTWSAIGKYQIPNPDPQYIVSSSDNPEIITNYAEHVDDILCPSTESV